MPEIGTGRLAFGLAAAAAVAIAVIGSPESRNETDPAAPEALDLVAEAQLPRLVRDERTVAILVTNQGTGPVWVRDVELVTASFAPTGPAEQGVVIQPGMSKALAVVYGEGQCGGQATPPLAPATARLVVAPGSEPPADAGRWQTLELPLAHAGERLVLRLRDDCAARAVAGAVELRVGDWSSMPDGRLRGTLVVERRAGDEPIIVHKLTGSTLYALAVQRRDGEIGRLPPGADRLEVPVVADAARCDGHAMADVKFPYRFRIWVTVGEAAELPTTADTEPDGEAQLTEMWHVRCGS